MHESIPEDPKKEAEEGFPHQRKMPEFIFIDGEEERKKSPWGKISEEYSHSFKRMKEKEYPFFARFVCFVGSLFLFFAAVMLSPFLITFFLFNLITFGKIPRFSRNVKTVWKYFKKLFVLSLALMISTFSPAFGLSIAMVYFLLQGEKIEDEMMAKIMKKRFYQ